MSGLAEFDDEELKTLHSLTDIFQDKKACDELRRLLDDGTTLRELIMAYKTNRRIVASLKSLGALIVLAGGVVAALRGLNLWPR